MLCRPWGHRGQPTGRAKTGGTISNRGSSVSACVGLGASPDASACARATGVRVWQRRWRLRNVWRWGWRECVGLGRRGRRRVAVSWAWVWRPQSTWSHSSRAPVPYGRPSTPGGSSHSPCPCWESNRGGPRRQRPAAGRGQASCGRWRWRWSDQRVGPEAGRFVVVHSSPLAQQQAQTAAAAQGKDAEAVADHVRPGHPRWCACRPEAEAASTADEGRGQGRRGRQPRPGR